jgi:hypothetical protein
MRDLYPNYDVLSKRNTLSWNEQTRRAIDRRLAVGAQDHGFFSEQEWQTLGAICERIIPQPADRQTPVPVAALIDRKMIENARDGYRHADLPPLQEAWQRALAAMEAEAQTRHDVPFHRLGPAEQDALLEAMRRGELHDPTWNGMPPDLFFKARMIADIVKAYYSHPTAWSEIGWGGPASPRGYVRLQADRRDPWEAAEAKPGRSEEAARENRRVGR